jgi:hypothetical protein
MAHWKKRETLFVEDGVRCTLPGHWQLRPSDEPGRWIYRSADRREQVTIVRAELNGGSDEDVAIRRAVLRHRKAVELGFDRAHDLVMTEPDYSERDGFASAFYSGTANDERHRFCSLLLFPERTVWSFFYETFNLSETEAIERAEGILKTVTFTQGAIK